MLLVILGIVIVVSAIIYEVKTGYKRVFTSFEALGMALGIVIGIAVVVVGLFVPIHGYHKAELAGECALEEVLPDTSIYVIESKEGAKTFKYTITNNNGAEEKESIICTNSDVKVVISNNEKRPVIRRYVAKPKTSILTFALLGEMETYKIFVTRDCIEK